MLKFELPCHNVIERFIALSCKTSKSELSVAFGTLRRTMVFCIILIADAKRNAEKPRLTFVAIIPMNLSGKGVKPTDFKAVCRLVDAKNIEDNLGELFQRIRIFIPEIEVSLRF